MIAELKCIGLLGIDAFLVTVEVDLSLGLPAFEIIGLPDGIVKEARDRVRSAIKNSGFKFPVRRIVVNLSPANIKKYGTIYDLSILLAILKADGQIENVDQESIFLGEVSLGGKIGRISGVLPIVLSAKKLGFKKFFIPKSNTEEAALVRGISVYAVENVKELAHMVSKDYESKLTPEPVTEINVKSFRSSSDFCQVKGQYEAKRALEIAAAGSHNLLMIGPPGSGKSMLAKRISGILPDMTLEEIVDVTQIYSVAGELGAENPMIIRRAFRSPHHTISIAGLAGGGSIPRPGEISLAHNGILFLDELTEFVRNTIEVLRQPLEDGIVTISRARSSFTYPCCFMLIAAMNPCPCGYFGHPRRPCVCSKKAMKQYLAKISGPILDRIDIHVEVPAVDFNSISSNDGENESSDIIRQRVINARIIQTERYKNIGISYNSKILSSDFNNFFALSDEANKILKLAFEKIGLSARAYDKILKISRTIADLEQSETIKEDHVAEAIQYRSLDRKYWLRS
ncbi:MAG: YifB family Mg chelatase-like AAA ATPase [Candidatus Improbicoccus devescovinae]|nr:MAG: YifB family Mg chelatase-like AAA ATPase [Candidatus Improbicoccus devescovinae]